ncbi:hypothetical protein QJQ45_015944 [Haematococcus lacustris]|nr:hypothetical protein QJQ45_015944 [Haematococcus lacustris]
MSVAVLDCKHSLHCSGCSLLQDLATPPQYQQGRLFFCNTLGLPDFPLVAGHLRYWRCRAKLAVRGTAVAPLIGLFRQGSHQVEPLPHCVAHHPSIQRAVAVIRQVGGEGELLRREWKGSLYASLSPHVSLWTCRALQVVLVWRAAGSGDPSVALAQRLSRTLLAVAAAGIASTPGSKRGSDGYSTLEPDTFHHTRRRKQSWQGTRASNTGSATAGSSRELIHSVWLNFQPVTGQQSGANAVLGRGWLHLAGPSTGWQTWWRDTPVALAPGSFVQANYGAFRSALALMAAAVPTATQHVVEFHAGVGAIGLSLMSDLIRRGPRAVPPSLRCVEINGEGEAPFLKSKKLLLQSLGCPTAPSSEAQVTPELDYSLARSTDAVQAGTEAEAVAPGPQLTYTVAAAGSDPYAFLAGADVVVVDPPRKGLEVELVEALAAADWPRRPSTTPRRILYLSCGFRSLQRDCAALLGAAGRPPSWRLVSACALLFFPGVDSIETLVVLEEVVQQQAMA